MTIPSSTLQPPLGVTVRLATQEDAVLVTSLIHELAAYEKLLHAVDTNPERVASALFANAPKVFCEIAEWNGQTAGFSVWFYNFSTFRGRHGIYLEDLFVRPDARGLGLGKALMRSLARRCVREGLARMEWSVLDWNQPSIKFYKTLGATLLDDWTMCRLTDDALTRLGTEG